MSDRDSIAKLLAERDWQLPQLTVETRGSLPVPEVGGRLSVPFAGGDLDLEGRYRHDRFAPEGGGAVRYRRSF